MTTRALVQWPLTEDQQWSYETWTRNIVYWGNDLTAEEAERSVSLMVEDGYHYWGTQSHNHFCKYPTMAAGWHNCMSCWTD